MTMRTFQTGGGGEPPIFKKKIKIKFKKKFFL